MALNCPHCAKEVGDFIPKDRFDAKKELAKELEGKLKEAEGKLAKLPELEKVAAEFTAYKAQMAERETIAATGFNGDAKALRKARALYLDATEDISEAERATFAEWLAAEDGGKAEGSLKTFFGTGTAAPPTDKPPAKGEPSPAAGKPSVKPPPRTEGGTRPAPPPAPKKGPEEVQALLSSPAWARLTPAEKRTRLDALEAEAGGEAA